MAIRRVVRGFPVARGARRRTQWVGPADQQYVAVATTAKTLIGSFTPATAVPSMNNPTVVRVRGEVSITPQAFSADVTIVGAYGVAIVSTDAFAAGAASVPGPFDDADWGGWLVWRSFSRIFEFADATGFFWGSFEQEVDSKAMRKMGSNDTMVLVAESQLGAFFISMPLRFLMKLS